MLEEVSRPHAPAPGGLGWDEELELAAADGVRLRGALWRGGAGGGRGLVVMLQGRTEFLEKYAIPAAALVRRGFAVASLDWRGQGRSARLIDPPLKGHVRRFTDYHRDLEALLSHPSVAGIPGCRLVLAHSMGATIALGAVLRGRVEPAALILSAPMLGIAMTGFQRLFTTLSLPLAGALGKREAWPPFPGVAVPYVFSGFEGNVLTADSAAFAWLEATLRADPALQLGMPTFGWFEEALGEIAWIRHNARPLGCPGLCLLGTDEAVVDRAAIREGSPRLGIRLTEIEGARHELLIAAEPMRSQTWAAIDQFLDEEGF